MMTTIRSTLFAKVMNRSTKLNESKMETLNIEKKTYNIYFIVGLCLSMLLNILLGIIIVIIKKQQQYIPANTRDTNIEFEETAV